MDSALFAAIASDFDLTSAAALEKLCATLDIIRESAIEQEDLPFDPSGTATSAVIESIDVEGARVSGRSSGSSPNGGGTLASPTDATGLTSPLLSYDGDSQSASSRERSRAGYTVTSDGSIEFSGASFGENVRELAVIFHSLSRLDIEQSLRKAGNDPTKALDVLLNLAMIDGAQEATGEDSIIVPKGIEGFSEDHNDIGRQKGRKKKSKNKKHWLEASGTSSGASTPNKWETGKADIEYMCSRASKLSREKITSAYHANGMKLPAAIGAIASSNAPKDISEIDDDPVMLTQLSELTGSFPYLTPTTLVGLLRVTDNMPSAATDLANMMTRRPSLSAVSDMIKFTAAPLNLEDDEETPCSRGRKEETISSGLDYEGAQAAAQSHFAAGSTAYQQASQAARRARSSPLYGGASAYYRERGQEHRALAMQQLAVASNHLVDRQSTNCDLDLHGVTVPIALRIVRERVAAWWDSLGDTKHVRGGGKHVHGGFKIVTGVGNHSQDGTSRLGPAVSKMLMQGGWRVEVGRGSLVVTGVARR